MSFGKERLKVTALFEGSHLHGTKSEGLRRNREERKSKRMKESLCLGRLMAQLWKSGVFSLRFLDGGKRKFDISLSSFIGWRVRGSSCLFLDRPHLALTSMVTEGEARKVTV